MRIDFVKRTKRQFWLEGITSRLVTRRPTDLDTVHLEVSKFRNVTMVRVVEYISGGYGRGNWCTLTASQVDPWVLKAVKEAEKRRQHASRLREAN